MLKSILPLCLFLTACASEPVRKSHKPHEGRSATAPAKEKLIIKAQNYYHQGNITGALRELEAIRVSDVETKDRAEYWNLKGLVELAGKTPHLAGQSFQHALEENQTPEYRGYYQYNLATSLYNEGKYRESYDILNAIDLGSIDQGQQGKVLSLKEKSSQGMSMAKKKTAPSEITVTGSPDAAGKGIPPAPTEVYGGSTNRRKIGLLIPLKGKYEAFGKKVQRAVELAFQHSNDDRAKEFEIVAEDSGDTADTQLAALQKLVEEHQVIAAVGPVLSKGMDLIAQKAAYYQVPLISLAQVQGPPASHVFFCSVSIKDQVSQTVQFAMGVKGFKKFAIIAPSNKPGEEMAQTFKDEVTAREGQVVHAEFYDPNITDFRGPVDKILSLDQPESRAEEQQELARRRKELNITRKTTRTAQYFNLPPIIDFDAVFIADEAKTAGQIIPTFTYRDAKNLNYLGITSWNSAQLVQRAQDQVNGAIFPVAFNTIQSNPDTKAFYDLYTTTYNTVPGELDALAFDAASLLLKGLKNAPSSRDEFRLILETTGNVPGATGIFSIQDHRCSRSLVLVQVQKGRFEVISGDNTL